MTFLRFRLSSTSLIGLVSLYFALVLNYPFYAKILSLQPLTFSAQDAFLLTVPLFVFFVLNACFQLLALPWLHKIVMPLLLIISATISYNALFFDVYFTRDMLTNVMQTTLAESSRLITLPFVLWVGLFGGIPALLYLSVKVHYRPWLKEIAYRFAAIMLSALVLVGIGTLFYQDYASFSRNNKTITALIVPSNFIGAGISKYKRWLRNNTPHQQIDQNAAQAKPDSYRHITVIVMGETTRAQNWGLNGYSRQTTPLLAKRGDQIINFRNVESCDTFTAGSVPCLFSNMDRANYDALKAEKSDTILDILQRSGVEVVWLDNDTGCKGVCDRVPYKDVTALNLPEFCRNGECLDNILLPELDRVLAENERTGKDIVVVLHTMGSHGPTYYERYSPEFRYFSPTCDTNEINRCTKAELVNTYDNSIIYIDQFIDKVIQRLEYRDDVEGSVIYLSDHGESLGEKGIYLHSTPRSIAPEVQTKVPMVMWFNSRWWQNEGIDFNCLTQNARTKPYSHDNFYSTIYGIMDMETRNTSYRAEMDIVGQCKKR
ncbi:sulfatase [[Actinobacillus] muris]|uniref:Sulfatase n=1 Tax=Muribacter muris TaxID=67855 RepID=A0A0J5S3S9_9PAST|nr:phosphoethanolamine--lipid A transferase [Muribacter muris]KMK51452.1 sulfatase [[Actinobacillus] muris] [Muribacter muris]